MACCNIWGTAKLNFGTTILHFLADFVSNTCHIDIAIFADDNKPYLFTKNVEHAVESLERASVRNADKLHFLVSTSREVSLNVNNFKVKYRDCDKLLGVKFDSNLDLINILKVFVEELAAAIYTY